MSNAQQAKHTPDDEVKRTPQLTPHKTIATNQYRFTYRLGHVGTMTFAIQFSADKCERFARLIAAAPEMYEALQRAEYELARVNACRPHHDTQVALEIARAALAKAGAL